MAARLVIQALRLAGEAEPGSLVLIDCSSQREAEANAKFLRTIQNGEATLRSLGDSVMFGDAALKLSFPLSEQTPERVLVTLTAQRAPGDWTAAVYLQTEVDRESAEVFRYFHTRRNSYALTMSVDGVPQTELLYLVKYVADYPWRARLTQQDPPPGSDMKDVMTLSGLPGWDQAPH